jgi:hypothetical protein
MSVLNNTLKTMFVKGTFAIGAGLLVEFIVDFFTIPILSESGLFGNSKYSNYEIIVYGLSTAGSAAGAMDYFSGYGMGTALYEHVVAPRIKGVNPYKTVYNAIPNVPLL